MKNKSISIPMGMVTKKFYCHKCGARLDKHSKTRTVSPGDPDYRKHNRINHRTHMIGDVEVTEYDFQCPSCGNIVEYDEQRVIKKIQMQLHKNTLSEEEILNNKGKAEETMDRNAKVFKVIFVTIALAVIGFIFYSKIKSGDFSFTFYF
ncbi:MAG: hypothetical protein IKA44_01065 [Clostridia bacterium]|nr:hypothetical protein [Clostridia bacterium]